MCSLATEQELSVANGRFVGGFRRAIDVLDHLDHEINAVLGGISTLQMRNIVMLKLCSFLA